MNLQQIIATVEAYEAKLPYNIRYQVGQDGPLVWVRAWELRILDSYREPQRRLSEKVIVTSRLPHWRGPHTVDVIDACFEAAQNLMERE